MKEESQVNSEIWVRKLQAWCQVKGNGRFKETTVSEKKDDFINSMTIVYLCGKTAFYRNSNVLCENMAASL